ncbi:MAG: hypothetical protein ACR2KX_09270, partial [Chitinophagaceae bacterium]
MKNVWRIIIVVVIIIIILNPSYTDFKEYTGLLGKDTHYLHKKNNFLLFSIYEDAKYKKTYLGVLMNFIDITYHPNIAKAELTDSVLNQMDSTQKLVDVNTLIDTTTLTNRSGIEVNYVDVITLIGKLHKPIFVDSATFVNSIIPDDLLEAFG